VVGDRVGPGITRTQQAREASPVASANRASGESPTTLVMGTGALLGLGVDLDQCGVDVQDDRVFPLVAPDRRHTSRVPLRRLRLFPLSSQARSRGRSGTPSSPTASTRTGPLPPAGTRCRHSSHHPGQHQHRLDEHLARSCSGILSPEAGWMKRAYFRVPTGRQMPQERASRHGQPPGHRQMPQRGDACCYRAFCKCPSGLGTG